MTTSFVGSASDLGWTAQPNAPANTASSTQSRTPVGPLYRGKVRLSISKTFNLIAGHYLPWHVGKCKTQHGHNYKIEVTM
ncbi:MAG TPA: 6-carboxytetrahydropterin synthase, partial [Ktedonobacteraceae bacterium]|nr:6-carboxytetrahydropterin synthase [Ktedonobacteraceae bacterium]